MNLQSSRPWHPRFLVDARPGLPGVTSNDIAGAQPRHVTALEVERISIPSEFLPLLSFFFSSRFSEPAENIVFESSCRIRALKLSFFLFTEEEVNLPELLDDTCVNEKSQPDDPYPLTLFTPGLFCHSLSR